VGNVRLTMMGELTALFAHEIEQPLAEIVTNGDLCLRQLASAAPDLQEVRLALVEIVNDGNRANAIISRIRALFMKGASNQVDLNIHQLVREVVTSVRREIDQNTISLRSEIATDLPTVFGDRVQLQQVLTNVVMNSIEAMREITDRPREILINATEAPERVCIQVHDSGPGLDPDTADRIFEPFFTTKPEGVGLGLSISRFIVESHGGRMWATPSSPGAFFEFTLPTGRAAGQEHQSYRRYSKRG
jgi:signal transduction histidine kinase